MQKTAKSLTFGRPWLHAWTVATILAFAVAGCGKKKSSSDPEPAADDPVTVPVGGDQPTGDDGGATDGLPDDPVVDPVAPVVASVAHSTVSVSVATVTAGSQVTLRLTAKTKDGDSYKKGGATVVFSLSGGTSSGTIGTVTDQGDGTYTALLSATTAGTAAGVHATYNGNAVTTAAPTITITPGAASAAVSTINADAAIIGAGSTATVTVDLFDAYGNHLTAGGASLVFAHAGGSATGTFGAVTDHANGTYSVIFTGNIAGTATDIGATLSGAAIGGTQPAVAVIAGPASVDHSVVTVSSGTVFAGSDVTLTLTMHDVYDNALTSGGAFVGFSHSGGTSTGTIGSVTDMGDGTYTALFTGTIAGTATDIGATIEAVPVTTTAPTVTVVASSASASQSTIGVSSASIASGSTSIVTLTVRDALGNQHTTGGLTVAFSRSGGVSTGTFGAVTDHNDGTYSAVFTGVLSGSATTMHATINSVAVTSALPTITVNAGPISTSQSIVSVSPASIASGATSNVTLTAKDAAGNLIPSGGRTVVFSNSGGTSTGAFGGTTDNGDGTYDSVFTGNVSGTATTIGATIDSIPVSSAHPTITVNPGAFSLALSTVTVSQSSIASGATSTLTATLRDAQNNVIVTGGRTVVFTQTGGTSTGTISGTTDNGDGTYTATFTGVVAGSARTIGATIDAGAITSASPTITVTPGAPNLTQSTVTVSSGSIASGSTSTLTLTARDGSGNQQTSGGLTVVFNRSGGTSTGTISATTDNNDGTYTATFTGVLKGTATNISATMGGSALLSAAPTITVTQGPISLSQSIVTRSSGSITAGNTSTFTLTAKDAAGNQFASGGFTVAFNLTGGTSAGSIDVTTDNTNGTYTAVFTGETAGTVASIHATIDAAAVTSAAPTITVTPGAFDLDTSSVATTDDTVVSNETATVTLTARDAFGNQLTGGGLSVTFAYSGGSSTFDIGTTTDHANGTYSAIFTGITSGSAVDVVGQIGGADLTSSPASMTTLTGPVSADGSTVTVSSATVASGDTMTVTLHAKDINGNAITTGGSTVTFSHSNGTSTGTFGATADLGNGTYTAVFTGAAAGTATDIVGNIDGDDLTTSAPTVTVTPSADFGYVFESFDTSVNAGDPIAFTISVKDGFGNVVTNYTGTIHFTSTDPSATLPANYTFTLGDAGVKNFSVTLTSAGTQSVLAEDTLDATIDGSQTGIGVAALAASKLGFQGPTAVKAGICSATLSVATEDMFNNAATVGSDVTVDLSGAGAGAYYSDNTCSTPVTSIVIGTGTSTTDVYIKNDTVESLTLIAEDQGAVLTDANFNFEVEPYQAWVGANSTPSWFASTGTTVRGRYDEQLNLPMASAFDGNNYFYVVDGSNNRLMKYDATDGHFVGWSGRVGATPTGGDAGCSSTPVNSATPGWCLGGKPVAGAGNGNFNAPQAIVISGTNAYIADGTNNRIVRYDLNTGLFSGWIGKILTSPNGGDAGCSGAAVGTFTPGWCMGGTSATGTTGTGNGHMNAPRAMVTDGTTLYLADASNHRIQRFDLATGAFTGWLGNINTSPTGGDAGCAGAAASTFTPGWCTGGTAKTGTGNGMMNTPRGITMDSTYLYVTDSGNHRIQRFITATGAYGGWIGRVNTVPTGGPGTCTSTAVSAYTPNWCTGGTAKTGTGNGHMNTPYRIYTDGTSLLISDYGNQRITKVAASNGAFNGWIGRVLTSPTGGAAGCNGAAINSATPGWCTAGTASLGADNGMFYNVQGLDGDGTYIYVADSSNHRVSRFSIATGAAFGWLGARGVATSSWSQASPSSILSGYGDQQFNALTGVNAYGGNLYVADTSNHRLQRFSTANGTFTGWIGSVLTSPTGGDAGCAGAAVTTRTPGWCTGGNSKAGTGTGHFNAPQGMYSDASNMFVLDSTNHRIVKYNPSTGLPVGWIGLINTSPTGGDAGCSGAAANTFTPGWCVGGTSKAGTTGNGSMSTPVGINGNTTYLYVTDAGHRILRYNKATGAFGGWLGRIATSPTGGDAGCAGATVGTYTPGWCTGGTGAASTADGNLNTPRGIGIDGTYLYVASYTTNARITRHALSDGAFGGWIGRISTSPTGGAMGCAGAAVNAFTPGWCTGGTGKTGNGDGHMNGPRGVTVVGGNLYVVDVANNRVNKYDASTGAFIGWSGAIATVPTGGDPDCDSALVGDLTPGWCTGGTSKAGSALGMFDAPSEVTADGTYLYVSDINNARVTRVPQ